MSSGGAPSRRRKKGPRENTRAGSCSSLPRTDSASGRRSRSIPARNAAAMASARSPRARTSPLRRSSAPKTKAEKRLGPSGPRRVSRLPKWGTRKPPYWRGFSSIGAAEI
jgi:hypothetical protein